MSAPLPPMLLGERIRRKAFRTPFDTFATIIIAVILSRMASTAIGWAFLRAVFRAENVAMCRAPDAGACWSVIDARHRLIMFGLYPYDQHWRSTLAAFAIIATVVLSCIPWFWSGRRLISLWIVGFATYFLLMEGSLLGLEQVTTDNRGGLSLVLFLFSSVVLLGMLRGWGLP